MALLHKKQDIAHLLPKSSFRQFIRCNISFHYDGYVDVDD